MGVEVAHNNCVAVRVSEDVVEGRSVVRWQAIRRGRRDVDVVDVEGRVA